MEEWGAPLQSPRGLKNTMKIIDSSQPPHLKTPGGQVRINSRAHLVSLSSSLEFLRL